MNSAEVTGLFVYPIKSMKGIALSSAQLTNTGLLWDRHWMVVNENSRFMTQREIPRLSLIETSLNESGVELSTPGLGSISVSFQQPDGEPIETSVWGTACWTIDQGALISEWLTQALQARSKLRLVRMNPEFIRPQKKHAQLGRNNTTLFADAAPFLVANQASLDKLNSILEAEKLQAVPMNRFRPNIVIRGLEPFLEHKVSSLDATQYSLGLCYPCERCIVTTIDQQTAQLDLLKQPFKMLRAINPMPDKNQGPAFAENAILLSGDSQTISVGNRLSVTLR